jgi:hypothetical protein
MLDPWVIEEMKSVDLKDPRLNRRLVQLLAQLAGQPTASLPAACGGHAELAAAYRFFDNDKVGFEAVLQPHIDCTRIRIAAQPVALLVPDTTEIDLTRPEQQVEGAGPLAGPTRRGLFLHLLHAFTPDGTPLGTVQAIPWARDDRTPDATRTRGERAATPIEEKESYRWLLAIRQARQEAARCPGTRIIWVADSESDIYEVIAAGMESPRNIDWVIRCCQDRALVDDLEESHGMETLRQEVRAAPVLFQKTIPVRGRTAKVACEDRGRRQPRKSRDAVVEVRAARVTLRAPARPAGQEADVTVNAVLVREANPPADDVAVEWMLLSSLPIDTIAQVCEITQYYLGRWMIELLNRVLKSGCRVERRRFERLSRVLPCLAVYLIVAWRTLYLTRLGRSCPDLDCEAVFDPSEWQSVYQVVRGEPPPRDPPRLGEMIRMVAQLGGYVSRKRGDEPGPQTIWLGLQRMHDMALCWESFGPGQKKRNGRDRPRAKLV